MDKYICDTLEPLDELQWGATHVSASLQSYEEFWTLNIIDCTIFSSDGTNVSCTMYFQMSDVWLLRTVVTGMLRWRLQLIARWLTMVGFGLVFYYILLDTTHFISPPIGWHHKGTRQVRWLSAACSKFLILSTYTINMQVVLWGEKNSIHDANFSSRGSLLGRLILDVCKESAGSVVRPRVTHAWFWTVPSLSVSRIKRRQSETSSCSFA